MASPSIVIRERRLAVVVFESLAVAVRDVEAFGYEALELVALVEYGF